MENLFIYITIFIIVVTIIVSLLPKKKKSDQASAPSVPTETEEILSKKEKTEEGKLSLKELKKINAQNEKQLKAKAKRKITNPEHPFFLNSFKGFSDEISDFAFSPNYIAIACQDKSLKLFKLKQLADENPFYYLLNISINYPTCVCFSSINENMLVCGLSAERTIEIFEFKENDVNKKYFHSYRKFPTNLHKEEVKNVYFVSSSCIITFGGGSDTTIKVWNSNCELLTTVDTKQVKHHCSTMSFTSRFLFVGSWCPDVKVFEAKLDKNDKSFKSLAKIMDLGLHKQGMNYISCSQTEEKVVTISQDKTLRIWNINVEYEKRGDPKCLLTVDMRKNDYFNENCVITAADVVDKSNGTSILALAEKNNITLVNLADFKVMEVIEKAHSEESVIKMVRFLSVDGQVYLFSYGSVDCRINIFKVGI